VVEIEVLARDEWGGGRDMAQILAAFVSPNDPSLPRILKAASAILEAAKSDGSLEGYQRGDPARVYMIAASIWSAITGLGLTYTEPPKSFELAGQKVRDPSRVLSEGLATCLDTSLLFASALEAVGLNPVVIFKTGHALAGLWLVERVFDSVEELDVTELRKAIAANEFVPFETTLVTQRPAPGFDQAIRTGKLHLSEAQEVDFDRAIDITRARSAGIRPLASHQPTEVTDDEHDSIVPAALPAKPDFGLLPGDEEELIPSSPQGRIERWQRKLLDLSLRNRLLNFVDTKQVLPFVCPDVPELEDLLASGKRFRIVSLNDEDPVGERDSKLHQEQTGEDIHAAFTTAALERKEVCVPLSGVEMGKRLITLNRRAKSDLSEGGTNTLFLAAGFLRWKKSVEDDRTYRAPLLLLPIKLSRRSAQSDFYLSHHEDEIRINSTLLEFLERDFGLEIPSLRGELPTDDSGLDLPRIFELMRVAVRDVSGFEVVEDLALSTFSFSKYLMWKDLVDRTDSLRANRLVRHLIDNPDQTFTSAETEFPRPEDIDRRYRPADLLTPLPADSSQLAAVLAAAEGHDFVVIGPPGTGKSQTIANMIAHCLAHKKSVLFVAEKSAALDVVYRRLKAYGLGDACLELHSNKTDRRSVIAQLGAAWDRKSRSSEKKWIKVTDELELTRDKLNAYVQALHAPGSHGVSIFQAIGLIADQEPFFDIGFDSIDEHSLDELEELQSLSEQAARIFQIVKSCKHLKSIHHEDWSFAWQARLLELVDELESNTRAVVQSAELLERALALTSEEDLTKQRCLLLSRFTKCLELTAPDDYRVVADVDFDRIAASITEFETAIASVHAERSRLAATYNDSKIERIPVEDLDKQWRDACTKFWPFSIFAKGKARKLLQTYAESGQADPDVDLAPLRLIQENTAKIAASPLAVLPDFKGVDSDLQVIKTYLSNAAALREVISDLNRVAIDTAQLNSAIEPLLKAGGDREPTATIASNYAESQTAFRSASAAYEAHAGGFPEDETTTALLEELSGIKAEKAQIADWSKWVAARSSASKKGLDPLLGALPDTKIENAIEAFNVAYFTWWLPLAMDASDELRAFLHWEHQTLIETFCKLDQSAQDLAAKQVQHAVAHKLPARDEVPRKSALGTLRHQLGLQRPSSSIRKLIAEMSETVTQLTPCVLMSPLSVAQYLPTDHALFDIVIFDEASQITTWDAVGSIARGTQSVIVGDPKQLPPTNFFGRSADECDEDLEDYEKDLPSILDEANNAGLSTHQLNWHYRSRDEALIAFSNHHYYGERLVTFPSPTTEFDAVVFHKVDGIYARGSGRTNEVEARAIADFAVGRMHEWLELPEAERLTLGVITFNVQQQESILDMLDAERRKSPEIEWFFDDEREEPLIVKNLENIQGDERDVMLFSITFGPDSDGKTTMNFGAINNDGGEKRLNVAVTRARAELHVYSSITAEQIDLARSKARGVADLKNFLDYAERGSAALPASQGSATVSSKNRFESSVAKALQAKGWEARTQIGVSGFRIDIGVVHPDSDDTFLAGIECDGQTYHSSASARDRDRIRAGVLKNLGWEILRVWSTDWFRDSSATVARLDEALSGLLATARKNAKSNEADSSEVEPGETEPSEADSNEAEPSEADSDEAESGAVKSDDTESNSA
ncbi:MAG: very-short-patch-repair endonuclease, partial [Planctomycetota bacterium]